MALRLNGQLLLVKIEMAFRPGIVSMTEDQSPINKNAITLQENNIDLDLLLPNLNFDFDFEDRTYAQGGQHIARQTDITLASANDFQLDYNDIRFNIDIGGDGIGSQDIDLGLDFGDGAPEVAPLGDAAAVTYRLTTPPPTPPPIDPIVSPRAGEAIEQGNQESVKRREFLNKKQIIDRVTELEDGPRMNLGRASQAKVSEIVTRQQFLPRSRNVMRLLEIRQDPLAHFVPTKTTATKLAEMFTRPIANILVHKRRDTSPEKPNKKARLDKKNIEEEDEQACRAEGLAPSAALGNDVLRHGDLDHGGFDFGGDQTGSICLLLSPIIRSLQLVVWSSSFTLSLPLLFFIPLLFQKVVSSLLNLSCIHDFGKVIQELLVRLIPWDVSVLNYP
ncbi:uncharacterized protein FOMMEDRAFT_156068 [Fomitiporia mediterranea MF3/22]|uniref:uncharacterized protein n=1 Tax=Fomitiporia mediterranea (strain MF3/22) TaxID=694068 RepID=UPI0004408E75|nr:uncharacterized protein FOMMEDRAFT_156068 [Fomitiporia mediterranea MF3/22]EJD02734.1 hypothetical protein FOMMEDRAFT_156068 [Fomitiporia mediterranea MF3/22]